MADSSPLPMTNGSSVAKGTHVRVSGAVGARCRHFKHRSISSNGLVHCEYLQHKKCHSIGQCREKKEKKNNNCMHCFLCIAILVEQARRKYYAPSVLKLECGVEFCLHLCCVSFAEEHLWHEIHICWWWLWIWWCGRHWACHGTIGSTELWTLSTRLLLLARRDFGFVVGTKWHLCVTILLTSTRYKMDQSTLSMIFCSI